MASKYGQKGVQEQFFTGGLAISALPNRSLHCLVASYYISMDLLPFDLSLGLAFMCPYRVIDGAADV